MQRCAPADGVDGSCLAKRKDIDILLRDWPYEPGEVSARLVRATDGREVLQMRIEMGPPLEMAARDTLVLASDGLLDNLLPSEIVEFVRSGPLDRAVSEMVTEVQRRMATHDGSAPCKPDDLTVIAYRAS